MPIELKPCPFCGGEAHFATKRNDIFSLPLPWVVCSDCGAETSYYESPEEAAEAWNRRANNG